MELEPTLYKKFTWSALTAAVFVAVSIPQLYQQTGALTGLDTSTKSEGSSNFCPTPVGKLVHAGVFFIVMFMLIKLAIQQKWGCVTCGKSDAMIAKYAIRATLIFLLVSSTDAYQLTRYFDKNIASDKGCPSLTGVIVHGVIVLLLVLFSMYMPNDR